MKVHLIVLLVLGSFWALGQNKSKQDEFKIPAVIVVDEIKVQRTLNRRIYLDGSVHNGGDLPLKGGLVMIFDFQDGDGKAVSTRRGVAYDEEMAPDDSTEFHFELPDEARAVQVMVRGANQKGMEVEMKNRGPFWIE